MAGPLIHGVSLSMAMYKSMGQKLIKRATALDFAHAILRDTFTEKSTSDQLPLEISETDDIWIVRGRPREAVPVLPEKVGEGGRFEIQISKFDGQILDVGFAILTWVP